MVDYAAETRTLASVAHLMAHVADPAHRSKTRVLLRWPLGGRLVAATRPGRAAALDAQPLR